MLLFDFLRTQDPAITPGTAKVHLACWNGQRPPLHTDQQLNTWGSGMAAFQAMLLGGRYCLVPTLLAFTVTRGAKARSPGRFRRALNGLSGLVPKHGDHKEQT